MRRRPDCAGVNDTERSRIDGPNELENILWSVISLKSTLKKHIKHPGHVCWVAVLVLLLSASGCNAHMITKLADS